jgi:uncharacterized protein involved in exopolysaccharide biosynthesis
MIADFDRQAASLDREIRAEDARSGRSDPSHFAYPMYAKALITRRDNLRRSCHELKSQLEATNRDLREAISELALHVPPTIAQRADIEGLLAFAGQGV